MAKVKKIIEFGVYSISHNSKLLYIGSSNNFDLRRKQHIKKLQDGKHQKSLQKYINENVIDLEELEFKIIHKTLDSSKIRLFFAEMILILLKKPSCNKAVFQIGLKYISLGNSIIPFNEEILKFL